MNTIEDKIRAYIEATPARSAWDRGVKKYAVELSECLCAQVEPGGDYTDADLKKYVLDGAQDWMQYSYGGCSLVYNADIAARLCAPCELRKTQHGARKPSRNEGWLDVQALALHQAYLLMIRAYKIATEVR